MDPGLFPVLQDETGARPGVERAGTATDSPPSGSRRTTGDSGLPAALLGRPAERPVLGLVTVAVAVAVLLGAAPLLRVVAVPVTPALRPLLLAPCLLPAGPVAARPLAPRPLVEHHARRRLLDAALLAGGPCRPRVGRRLAPVAGPAPRRVVGPPLVAGVLPGGAPLVASGAPDVLPGVLPVAGGLGRAERPLTAHVVWALVVAGLAAVLQPPVGLWGLLPEPLLLPPALRLSPGPSSLLFLPALPCLLTLLALLSVLRLLLRLLLSPSAVALLPRRLASARLPAVLLLWRRWDALCPAGMAAGRPLAPPLVLPPGPVLLLHPALLAGPVVGADQVLLLRSALPAGAAVVAGLAALPRSVLLAGPTPVALPSAGHQLAPLALPAVVPLPLRLVVARRPAVLSTALLPVALRPTVLLPVLAALPAEPARFDLLLAGPECLLCLADLVELRLQPFVDIRVSLWWFLTHDESRANRALVAGLCSDAVKEPRPFPRRRRERSHNPTLPLATVRCRAVHE